MAGARLIKEKRVFQQMLRWQWSVVYQSGRIEFHSQLEFMERAVPLATVFIVSVVRQDDVKCP